MNMDEAIKVLGINNTQVPLRNMVKALGFHSYMNTAEDTRRREAAQYVLRRWPEYCAECNKRRDALFSRRGK